MNHQINAIEQLVSPKKFFLPNSEEAFAHCLLIPLHCRRYFPLEILHAAEKVSPFPLLLSSFLSRTCALIGNSRRRGKGERLSSLPTTDFSFPFPRSTGYRLRRERGMCFAIVGGRPSSVPVLPSCSGDAPSEHFRYRGECTLPIDSRSGIELRTVCIERRNWVDYWT